MSLEQEQLGQEALPNVPIHQDIATSVPLRITDSSGNGFSSPFESPSQSDTASIDARSTRSIRSAFEDIKHEVMVNHLYQQQCARLWVSDSSGELEGVLLRKSRGNYLSCPYELQDSYFAQMCTELNAQVSCSQGNVGSGA